jgi:hypothetical protein
VASYTPDPATGLPVPSSRRYFFEFGPVASLEYQFTQPGGFAQATFALERESTFRVPSMNPGQIVRVFRGTTWLGDGKLLEPVYNDQQGWVHTVQGAGGFGDGFRAIYTSWNGDDPVNQAITRGLRWSNPGIGGVSGLWLGQPPDSGSQSVTEALTLMCSNGGLTWGVDRRNVLSVKPIPALTRANVTRLAWVTVPVARTIAADVNTIWVRYQATADNTTSGAAATFGLTSSSVAGSVSRHGVLEAYMDLSSAGTLAGSTAQGVANAVLSNYQRAAWLGPYSFGYGQLTNVGGFPVDPGCEGPGEVYQLMITDAAYGGEVVPGPVRFVGGATSYNNETNMIDITPAQAVTSDLGTMMQEITAALTLS